MNFDKWTYSEFADAFNYYREGNSEEFNKLLTKLTAIDYEAMDLEESTKAKFNIIQEMNAYLEGLDISKCKVNFKSAGWTDKTFRTYRAAMLNREMDVVEKMVKEVAHLEDENIFPDVHLTARQGCTMVKAVVQHYQDLLLGKV